MVKPYPERNLDDGMKQKVSVRQLLEIVPPHERESMVIRLHRAKVITLGERRAIVAHLEEQKLRGS